jgi:ribonuclease BN (tRNA processing enzyme)
MAYVTDTTARPNASYAEAIRGVDLLVHECYFPDAEHDLAELTGHSMTTPVAQLAKGAGVGRLLLVHIDPQVDEADPAELAAARKIFPETDWGRDRLEVTF